MKPLGPIDRDEIKVLAFAFASEMEAAAVIAVAEATCEAVRGIDAQAATRLVGVPQISGQTVLQRVGNCLPGVTYKLRVKATEQTTGLRHVIEASLSCE